MPSKIFRKVQKKVNCLRRDIRWKLGLDHRSVGSAKGARILVYHGICLKDPFRFNTLFIRLKVFERQLRLYKKYFHIISLDDFYQERFHKEKFNICLSFDDGFFNNYKYVLPLLEAYQIPACFFITGIRDAGYDILWNDVLSIAGRYGPSKFAFRGEEFIKNTGKKYIAPSGKALNEILRSSDFSAKLEMMKAFDPLKARAEKDYWLQMSVDEIKRMAASKWVTIGSHSYYHNDLAKTSGGALLQDMEVSKQYLEKITDHPISSLAFPYGSYSAEAIAAAKAAGYSQLLATEFLFPGDSNDPSLKERFTINPFISTVNQMHANIRGHY